MQTPVPLAFGGGKRGDLDHDANQVFCAKHGRRARAVRLMPPEGIGEEVIKVVSESFRIIKYTFFYSINVV
jgi:hypothetical protein